MSHFFWWSPCCLLQGGAPWSIAGWWFWAYYPSEKYELVNGDDWKEKTLKKTISGETKQNVPSTNQVQVYQNQRTKWAIFNSELSAITRGYIPMTFTFPLMDDIPWYFIAFLYGRSYIIIPQFIYSHDIHMLIRIDYIYILHSHYIHMMFLFNLRPLNYKLVYNPNEYVW